MSVAAVRIEDESSVAVVTITVPQPATVVRVGIPGPEGPPGDDGPQGPAGPAGSGLSNVEDDTSPSLGGDLTLGSYNINGQLENTGLIIDGGLL